MGLFGNKKSKKEIISEKLSAKGFKITKELYDGDFLSGTPALYMDDENNKLAVVQSKKSEPLIYDYRDILDFEVMENGSSKQKGHAGSAIVGGLMFGTVGAIAGASRKKKEIPMCKSLSLSITVNSPDCPRIDIPFITSQVKEDSLSYKFSIETVNEIASALEYMKNKCKSENSAEPLSAADEIKKFKSLLDDGTITQDEFNMKKKQLLGL